MKPIDLEPMDADARSALDLLREVEDLETNVQQAILGRVAQKAIWTADPDAPSASTPKAEPSTAAKLAKLVSAKATIAVVAGALGMAGGVALERTYGKPQVLQPTAPPAVASVTPMATMQPTATVIAVENLPRAIIGAPKPSTGTAQTDTVTGKGLSAERSLLDVARSALARGEAGEALRAAEQHRASYPTGVLAEEREALAIKALVALGRIEEARSRANAFERRFPKGLMLRAVRNAVPTEEAPPKAP